MYIKWGLLQIKHNIKSFSFWCVVVILILTGFICGYVEKEHSEELDVLLCSEDSSTGDRVIDYLLDSQMEGYNYQVLNSRDDIYTAIARGQATCGFVFTEDFDEAIRKMKPDGEVLLYQAVNTLDGYTLREVIYPAILTCSSDVLFASYLDKVSDDAAASEDVLEEFNNIMATKSLKIYDVVSLDGDDSIAGVKPDSRLSLFIMMGLLIVSTIITVAEGFGVNAAVFRAMKKKRVYLLSLVSAAINLIMLLIPVMISMILL